jgi:Cu2+-containing amine oxidase
MDGALEVRVHTTGYIQAAAWSARHHGTRWGHPLSPDVAGTIHDHLLHWKVDLDIGGGLRGAGSDNSVRLDEMKVEARQGMG